MPKTQDLTAWITGLVKRFLTESPRNNLHNKNGGPAWDEALVGFASGADPLFQEYKEYVKKTYNYEGYGCGLCQVGVPCETRIPVRKARKAYENKKLPPPLPPLA